MLEASEKIKPENIRFYKITQQAYFIGALGHFMVGFLFLWLKVYEMVWFNFIISVPFFSIALIINRQGRHGPAFSLAFFELMFHQIACVYFLGWDSGFQYILIYVAGLTFFNARWSQTVRIVLILVVTLSFFLVFLFLRTPGVYQFPKSYTDFFLIFNCLFTLLSIALLINYYVRAADKAESGLRQEQKKSEDMAALLKKMFGRYLSTEVMNALIEDPSTLELGGEKRSVTIMMTDLRGFTALCERLKPEDVVQMLNGYFEVMMEVIDKYHGTINEIIGDALLVIFGAPQEMPDRSQRAIACAIEMQNAMAGVNRQNRIKGLPELEMGIGLNETEVIVGNIGSSKRSKYAVVGSGVNLTSRIESYTVGGQILISESVYREAESLLRIDAQRDVFPKGSETPLRIYEVGGIAGSYNITLEGETDDHVTLAREIPLQYAEVEGKDTEEKGLRGFIAGLSKNGAEIVSTDTLELYSNLKMGLVEVDEKLSARHFYGKVIQQSEENGKMYTVRFTSVPPEIDAYFQAHLHHAVEHGKSEFNL